MADDELNELLDQLDTHTAESDATVERASESLEATLASLKLTPEEETALAGELDPTARPRPKARRDARSRSPPSAWSAGASRRSSTP